jgi:signal transduction histidine kinase
MQNDNHLGLILTHDGIGINQQDYEYLIDHSDGLGLASIKHRLNLISGEVLYKRQNKGGTINLIMPIN